MKTIDLIKLYEDGLPSTCDTDFIRRMLHSAEAQGFTVFFCDGNNGEKAYCIFKEIDGKEIAFNPILDGDWIDGFRPETEKVSTAYIVGDHDSPPGLPDGQNWHLLRLALKLMGKVEGESPLPDKGFLPSFYLVATDREAAKSLICKKIDGLFDTQEFDESQEEPDGVMYPTVRAWVDAIRGHTCDAKDIVSDDRIVMRLGYSCNGCGTWFGLRVTDFKMTIDDFGPGAEELKKALKTREGRVALAEQM